MSLQKIARWIDYRLPVFSFIEKELRQYQTPKNLNYLWNFGSLAGIVLVVMILSGIFLAMFYTPHADHAFDSIERIMRDVNFGWFIRYLHMNGASMFFIVVYIHIFRGLYYGSYKAPRELLWMLGVVILLLMMATAFMGYVLPWGQMSFWGATVITNLFSAIPIFGEDIVTWLWGGYSVDNPTLNRFFALHYLFPFLIVGVVGLHLIALHQHGSNNPLGIEKKSPRDTIPFHPYYTVKDLFGLGVLATIWAGFIFFAPNFFGEPDNYIKANPLVTPPHIVPEWYFLPFYAILRAVPDKLGGVCLMFGAVFVLFVLPWLDKSPVKSARFRPLYRLFFWALLVDALVLGWIGSKPPEGMYVIIGRIATLYYFVHFLIVLPLLSRIEKPLPLPESISEPIKRQADRRKMVLLLAALAFTGPALASGPLSIPKISWSFKGPLGTFDRAALQRGFQVFKEVCSTCHSLKLIKFRHLKGIGLKPEEIKALAAGYEVQDGPNDEGEMFQRKGRAADGIPAPYANDQASRAANNGALPPDLSLIVKARAGGADYVHALLTGYGPAPAGVKVSEGMHYNAFFPGHQIAMAPPLVSEGQVVYQDGTPASIDQMASDVTTFLAWAAEPELESRRQYGLMVVLFLIVFTTLMYFSMVRVWRDVH